MSRIAYVNGRYVPQREASVNVEDRGYQFADAVYEVVHVFNGSYVDEEPHLDRLERSLRELRIPMPMARIALKKVLREVVRRNRIREGLVYMQVSRGVARRDHAFPNEPIAPAIVITAKRIAPYQEDIGKWSGEAITQPDIRWGRCDIKTVGLLPNCLARQAAKEKGAIEAVLVDESGMVTEGAATNFWIVDAEGRLRTRHLDDHILAGVTRKALMALLKDENIVFEERAFSLEEARHAREAFITSATSFVKPILKLDGKPVGDGKAGPVVRRLHALFTRHVKGARNAA